MPATTDWSTVLQQATTAAANSLGGTWDTVSQTAEHSVQMLVDTGAYIETNKASLSTDDCNLLVSNQALAMKNVLLGYEAIGIASAEQAVAAAWDVVSSALQTSIGAALHI
jgi:hypothetical protein